MLVVAGATKDLLEGEVEILEEYLKNGGNMLFLLEPGTPVGWREFLARWGIVVGDGHIVDQQRSLGDNNEITVLGNDQYFNTLPEPFSFLGIRQLTSRLEATYYPGVTALEPAEGVAFSPTENRGRGRSGAGENTYHLRHGPGYDIRRKLADRRLNAERAPGWRPQRFLLPSRGREGDSSSEERSCPPVWRM